MEARDCTSSGPAHTSAWMDCLARRRTWACRFISKHRIEPVMAWLWLRITARDMCLSRLVRLTAAVAGELGRPATASVLDIADAERDDETVGSVAVHETVDRLDGRK